MEGNSKTGYISSNFLSDRERFAFIVEVCEFDNPETAQTYKIFKDIITDCKDKFFHTFENRCEFNNIITHQTSSDENFILQKLKFLNYVFPNSIPCKKKQKIRRRWIQIPTNSAFNKTTQFKLIVYKCFLIFKTT